MERLQKLLSRAGVASRREAERMILAGRVRVDGQVVTELGTQAELGVNKIEVDGQPISVETKRLYFLLNKPTGYLTTVKDDRGRKTVIDLMKGVEEYIYPIGRLDYDTEGLLLLTNDGELMNGLLHPSFEVKKTYVATVQGGLTYEELTALRKGVMLEDGMTAPAEVKLVGEDNRPLRESRSNTVYCDNGRAGRGRNSAGKDSANANGLSTGRDIKNVSETSSNMGVQSASRYEAVSWVRITIHEGRNRQVRRMLEAVGHKVIKLRRIRFAGLTLQGMQLGHYRELTADEVAGLKRLAGHK